jgi:hypothetical protein
VDRRPPRRLQEILERQTERSALLLRRVPSPACLVPTTSDVGRRCYHRAETALHALQLLEPPEGGSNWSGNRTARARKAWEREVGLPGT